MYRIANLIILGFLFFTACDDDEPIVTFDTMPVVKQESTYIVQVEEDITYAEGLGFEGNNSTATAIPLKLDLYLPDNDAEDRPVYMFIHGGGFTGGTKHKPEIVDMANYYASRGWVFASIDYRTTEELGVIQGLTPEELPMFY